jgi:hypothetical protein
MYAFEAIVEVPKVSPRAAQSHRLSNQGEVYAHHGALPIDVADRLLETVERRFHRE